jgi:hypothetical protein
LPLGVGIIFLLGMTSSLLYFRECHLVTRRRWQGSQSRILDNSPNAAWANAAFKLLIISQTCAQFN